jgi:hypothetical protein
MRPRKTCGGVTHELSEDLPSWSGAVPEACADPLEIRPSQQQHQILEKVKYGFQIGLANIG